MAKVKTNFQPVEIILETPEEVIAFIHILDCPPDTSIHDYCKRHPVTTELIMNLKIELQRHKNGGRL